MRKNVYLIPGYHEELAADYIDQTIAVLKKKDDVLLLECGVGASFLKRLLLKKSNDIRNKRTDLPTIRRPIFVPFTRYMFFAKTNLLLDSIFIRIYLKIKYKKVIIWGFLPDVIYDEYPFLRLISDRLIYDCVDYYRGMAGRNFELTVSQENFLAKSIDHFFVNSHVLKIIHGVDNVNVRIVPQGFCLDNFIINSTQLASNINRKKTIIGYVGVIGSRLDYDLLIKIVGENSDCVFVFWGPIDLKELKKSPQDYKKFIHLKNQKNTTWGMSQKKSDVKEIINSFDICIIPYNTKKLFNAFSYPMKVYEYLYLQKRVISTKILELGLLKFSGLIYCSDSPEKWNLYIKRFGKNPLSTIYKNRAKKIACENSWDRKVEKIKLFLQI